MFRSNRVSAEFTVTIHSINKLSIPSRLLYVQWKRGSKLSGRSRRSNLSDGTCVWQETTTFKCTLISTSQVNKFRRKAFEISIYEVVGINGSKFIGQVIIDLSQYINHEPTTLEFPISRSSHPSATLRVSVVAPLLPHSSLIESPLSLEPLIEDSCTAGDTTTDFTCTDATATEGDDLLEDHSKSEAESSIGAKLSLGRLSLDEEPSLNLKNDDVTKEEIKSPVTPRRRKNRTKQSRASSLFLTSPSNWGLADDAATSPKEAQSPKEKSNLHLNSVEVEPVSPDVLKSPNDDVMDDVSIGGDVSLPIPESPPLNVNGLVSPNVLTEIHERETELKTAQITIEKLERTEEERDLIDAITSSDYEVVNNLPLGALELINSLFTWKSFEVTRLESQSDIIVRSVRSLSQVISYLGKFTSSMPTPSLKRRQSISLNTVFLSDLRGLFYWTQGSLFIGGISRILTQNDDVALQKSLDFYELIDDSESATLDVSFVDYVCTADIDEISSNHSFFKNCPTCSSLISFQRGANTLAPKSCLSLYSHFFF
ncbi:hypothetical protein GEMRC1_005524 [Eukaryota sp. GEM-RC1]